MRKKTKVSSGKGSDWVEMLDIDVNHRAIEIARARKGQIISDFSREILGLIDPIIKSANYFGSEIKVEIPIGYKVEEPTDGVEEEMQRMKMSFLRELEYKGVIRDVALKISTEYFDDQHAQDYVCASVTFYPIKFSKHLLNRQVETDDQSVCNQIVFNKETGDGSFKGKSFRLKHGTSVYRLFSKLYETSNKKIGRYDVLVILHFYEDGEDTDSSRKSAETALINETVKELRRKTGLDKLQLVQNMGNVTLAVEIAPNPPQRLPK